MVREKLFDRHGDFLILHNYEMKAEIYCFISFTIAYRGISFVPNDIFSFYYSRLGRKGLIKAKQYLSS
jgi:hypothetical protein